MSKASTPLVSVIIPTYKRPALLLRAIDSCVASASARDIEIIVVANGGDSAPELTSHLGVIRTIELAEANGNAARNAGFRVARGEYVRFLDDDDYLLPDGAQLQLQAALSSKADVCSGTIQLTDATGSVTQTLAPQHADGDFTAAMLSPKSTTQPTAHLLRREFLRGLSWNPERAHLQDFEWMHTIVRRSELNWVTVDDAVGVWQHHAETRVSTGALKQYPDLALRDMAEITMKTIDALQQQGRLTNTRKRMAAMALWHYVHLGFPLSPLHWTTVAKAAKHLDASSRPEPSLFRRAPWLYLDPLVLEWILLAKRRLNHLLRDPS